MRRYVAISILLGACGASESADPVPTLAADEVGIWIRNCDGTPTAELVRFLDTIRLSCQNNDQNFVWVVKDTDIPNYWPSSGALQVSEEGCRGHPLPEASSVLSIDAAGFSAAPAERPDWLTSLEVFEDCPCPELVASVSTETAERYTVAPGQDDSTWVALETSQTTRLQQLRFTAPDQSELLHEIVFNPKINASALLIRDNKAFIGTSNTRVLVVDLASGNTERTLNFYPNQAPGEDVYTFSFFGAFAPEIVDLNLDPSGRFLSLSTRTGNGATGIFRRLDLEQKTVTWAREFIGEGGPSHTMAHLNSDHSEMLVVPPGSEEAVRFGGSFPSSGSTVDLPLEFGAQVLARQEDGDLYALGKQEGARWEAQGGRVDLSAPPAEIFSFQLRSSALAIPTEDGFISVDRNETFEIRSDGFNCPLAPTGVEAGSFSKSYAPTSFGYLVGGHIRLLYLSVTASEQ